MQSAAFLPSPGMLRVKLIALGSSQIGAGWSTERARWTKHRGGAR